MVNAKYSVGTVLKNHTTGSEVTVISVRAHKASYKYDLSDGLGFLVYSESTINNLYKVISTKEGYDSNVKSKYRF